MHSHTLNALRRSILIDLRVGQSTAASIAPRIGVDAQTVERVAETLVTDHLAETLTIAGVLTVYRATPRGLESIS